MKLGNLKATMALTTSFAKEPNPQLVSTPGTARHVSWCFRGRRGTAARYASREKLNHRPIKKRASLTHDRRNIYGENRRPARKVTSSAG